MNRPNLNRRAVLATTAASVTAATMMGHASRSNAAKNQTPLRVGQIGTRHAHASGKLETLLKYPEHFTLVGVAESDQARRQALSTRAPYSGIRWIDEQELLNDPNIDFLVVETEVSALVPTALRCLNHGKHIHLDKPAGQSLSECKQMHSIAQERDLTIQMGYMLRYNPAFQFARRIIRDGWLGEITEVSGMMGKFMSDAGRKELSQYPGGGMFELACHLIDQVVTLLGPPQSVASFNKRTYPKKDNFADNQLAVFTYPNTLATVRCNHIDPMGGARRQFSVTGTEGTFEIRPLEPHPQGRLGLSRARGDFKKGYQDVPFDKPAGRYDEEFFDLARVVRGETKLEWGHDHDVATQEAILKASGMPTR